MVTQLKIQYLTVLIALMGVQLVGWAQFSENFTNLNEWTGQTDKFEVLEGKLHLNDPSSSGSAYLVRSSRVGINATWEVTIRLAFAPSASNHLELVLMSDQEDLSTHFEGYFLKIGENGSMDALEFYRKDQETSTRLGRGIEGRFGAELDSFRIKVSRLGAHHWRLESDVFDGKSYQPEGDLIDSTYLTTKYTGLKCNYTSTRNDRFYFDDFSVSGDAFTDRLPPEIVRFGAISDSSILLLFNEALDTSNLSAANFSLAASNPGSITKTPSQITLQFGRFVSDATQTLQLRSIPDLAGNLLDTTLVFSHHQNQQFEVLITEIMADPSPVVGLPDVEYLELYNNTSVPLSLEDWTLSDNSKTHVLPAITLQPNAYVLLTNREHLALFNETLHKIAVSDLFTLNNAGDSLTLSDQNGRIIHQLSYTHQSYLDPLKEEGGYSLELTDLDQVCAGNLLQASHSPTGGTPGLINSIQHSGTRMLPRVIDLNHTQNQATILLSSSDLEGMDKRENYQIEGQDIKSLRVKGPEVTIDFGLELNPGKLVNLTVQNIQNCLGERLDTTLGLLYPPTLQKGQLLITEILFDPLSGASDYIEIYNPSDLYISLAGLLLLNLDPITSEITQTKTLPSPVFLGPHQYYVLTPNPASVLNNYQVEHPSNIIQTSLIPLNNQQGNVAIAALDSTIIDEIYYQESYHSQLLNNREGVSLERIDFKRPALDGSNWFSAPQSVGYGTPTSANGNQPNHSKGDFELERGNISPDGDGFEDDVFLLYQQQEPGTTLTLQLFTANGQLIKKIIENYTIENSGRFRIEGVNEMTALQAGIYVLHLEVSTPSGRIFNKRLALTVNRRF